MIRGRNFSYRDYQPPTVAERKKRERTIIEQNKSADTKLEIEYVRGGIRIQGEMYNKKVKAPTPRELVEIQPDEYEAMMATKMSNSQEITVKNSRFIGYSKPVNSHSEIRQLYKRMKLTHPGARHIVCAYWINYDDQPHYARDYYDDQEPNAGRKYSRMDAGK